MHRRSEPPTATRHASGQGRDGSSYSGVVHTEPNHPIPSFALTRSDNAELQKRMLAHAKAQLRSGAGRRSMPWWRAALLWVASVVVLVFLMRWIESLPSVGTHLAVGAVGLVVGVFGVWALFSSGTHAIQQAMFRDDGYCLSPQSVDVRGDCIEQRTRATHCFWQWAGFHSRQESDTLVFLFVDNAVCLPLPKAILTPETYALIEQRVPLQAP